MNSIEQVSLKYLALVVAAERKHRAAHPHQDPALMANRFWDARSIARNAGIDDLALREAVQHLATNDLLRWHEKEGRNPTVKLTEKGFREPLPPVLPTVAKPEVSSSRRTEPNTVSGYGMASVIASVIGLMAGSGGVVLVFLSRTALTQSIGGSDGRWKAVVGMAGLFVGGLLLGASLRRTMKALGSVAAARRNPDPA